MHISKIQTKELHKDLAILNGWIPYDGPENICRNDSYYASSIVEKYDRPLHELETIHHRLCNCGE